MNTADRNPHREENGRRTPDQSPRGNIDYEVPYETSHEARARLLSHNDMLAEENMCNTLKFASFKVDIN
jgi:hypothetical protein